MIDYKKKLEKVKAAAKRKEKRLLKRLQLAKEKPRRETKLQLRKRLRKITHAIVRHGKTICYTCDKFVPVNDRQAGHFWSDGSHSATRFDFSNLRMQGSCCNLYKYGNLAEYSIRLRKELGDEAFEALAQKAHQTKIWTREELEEMIEERKHILESLQ